MQTQELFEKDSDLTEAWIRRRVFFEQVAACNSKMRLGYGGGQPQGVFWRVEGVAHEGTWAIKIVLETAQQASETKVQSEWVVVEHIGSFKACTCNSTSALLLAIVERDIYRQPVWQPIVFFFNVLDLNCLILNRLLNCLNLVILFVSWLLNRCTVFIDRLGLFRLAIE